VNATYIIYLVQMAFFMSLDESSKWRKNYPTIVGTKELFTSSQFRLWITKSSTQRVDRHCN